MGRFVFDTNVLVSALLFKNSLPGQCFRRGLEQGTILISAAVIAELADVLSRAKFDRYVYPAERAEFLQRLVHEAELIEINRSLTVSRDPKDDKFLELAVC